MTQYAYGHPLFGKEAMAEWMGYPTVDQMDRDHDPLHAELCQWMGITSYSLLEAQGVALDADKQALAKLEEAAVLNVQRWLQHCHKAGEDTWVQF